MKNYLHEASEIRATTARPWASTELDRDEDIFPEGLSQAVIVHLLSSELLISG